MKAIAFKSIPLCTFLMSIGLIWAGCGSANTAEVTETNYKIAEISDKVITQQDLDSKIESFKNSQNNFTLNGNSYNQVPEPGTPAYELFQKDVAVSLVNEEVISAEASKMGISVSDLFKRVTASVPAVTDDEVQAYYSSNNMRTLHVRRICFADLATAREVKAQLDTGADFASMARKYYPDPVPRDWGGDLGDVPSSGSGFDSDFEKAMNLLAVGQISDPIKTGINLVPWGGYPPSRGHIASNLHPLPGVDFFEIIQVTSSSSQIPSCSNGACDKVPLSQFDYPHKRRSRVEPFGEWLHENGLSYVGPQYVKNPYNAEYAQKWLDKMKSNIFSKKQEQAFQSWLEGVKTNYDINFSDSSYPSI